MERTTKNYISLYNTVGLIEKDKNIYFVPHQADIYAKRTAQRTKVCDCYMELFNTVLSFSSTYNNLEISSWTPEDRTLRIEGTVDDFRQSRGNGLALNYLIVKREVIETDGNTTTTSHYFFAYFIDSVEQAGLSSVRLSLTPDYFTNLYYLNNQETLTENYDPFNTIMKNCFVERQHYDRFQFTDYERKPYTEKMKDTWLVVKSYLTNTTEIKIASDVSYSLKFIDDNNEVDETLPQITVKNTFGNNQTCIAIDTSLPNIRYCYYLNENGILSSVMIPTGRVPVVMFDSLDYSLHDSGDIVSYLYRSIVYKNLERILGSEESFKYKYQYKDKRLFLPITSISEDETPDSFSLNEYEDFIEKVKAVANINDFTGLVSRLSDREKYWFIQLFISYLNVIFKEDILLPTSFIYNSSIYYYEAGYNKYKGVNVPFTHIALPFVSIPKGFENIQKEWFRLRTYAYCSKAGINSSLLETITGKDVYSPERLLDYLSNGGNQYILTTFVSKYSPLTLNNYRGVDTDNSYVYFNYVFDIYQGIDNTLPIDSSTTPDSSFANAHKTISLRSSTIAHLPFLKTVGSGLQSTKALSISKGAWHIVSSSDEPHQQNSALYSVSSNGNVSINADERPFTYINEDSNAFSRNDLSFLVMVVGNSELEEIDISFKDNLNDINKFIDPLIESDPYSFYSISINETEQIISKFKLIESYDLDSFTFRLTSIVSYNDAYKIGLIPSYYINDKWNRYYTEAIVSIISSQVPVVESSWLNYYQTNKAQMKNQYAVQENNFASGTLQGGINTVVDMATGGISGYAKRKEVGAGFGIISGAIKGIGSLGTGLIANAFQVDNIKLSQKAKMSDMGAKPDTVKFAGSDILYDLIQNERGYYLNYYRIDDVSYNSICKYLERFGYLVNLFDTMNIFDRVGLNYIKVTSFDFVEDNFVLSEEQMNAVSSIFLEGVTLLHDKNYLHNLGETGYHNIEIALKEVI